MMSGQNERDRVNESKSKRNEDIYKKEKKKKKTHGANTQNKN